MAKRTLPLSKIRLDGNTQPRVELDEFLIAEYAQAYIDKAEMPPIQVMFDGASYWLWDGFHRRWAADRAGLDKLPCVVTEGTQQDAQWASYGANVTHGLRRTNQDKAKAVKAALRHPEGAKKSDHQIAEHVGVDHKTVVKYRSELESTREIPQSDSRTGRDGRTTNTANIGKKRKKRKPKEEPVTDDPPPHEATTEDGAEELLAAAEDVQEDARGEPSNFERIKSGLLELWQRTSAEKATFCALAREALDQIQGE